MEATKELEQKEEPKKPFERCDHCGSNLYDTAKLIPGVSEEYPIYECRNCGGRVWWD